MLEYKKHCFTAHLSQKLPYERETSRDDVFKQLSLNGVQLKKMCIAEGNTSYLAYVTNIKGGRYEKKGLVCWISNPFLRIQTLWDWAKSNTRMSILDLHINLTPNSMGINRIMGSEVRIGSYNWSNNKIPKS